MDELKQNGATSSVQSGRKSIRQKFAASLSLKLLGIFLAGSLVLLLLVGSLFRFGFERQSLSTAAPLLQHYVDYLSEDLGNPPQVARAQDLTERWPITIRIFDQTRDIRWASDDRLEQPRVRAWHPGKEQKNTLNERVYWDHGTAMIKREIGGAEVFFGVRFRPTGAPWLMLAFFALVLAAIGGFYGLTRRLFAPIKQIESGIVRIGDGELKYRIELDRSDELGLLAGRVNQMAGQLESMLQAKRDLLLAISHELKSPLARSRVTLALIEDSEYHQPLLNDQREMQALIDGIIEAERSQGDYSLLRRQPTDMVVLVGRVLSHLDGGDTILCQFQPEAIQADIDAMQIERLLRNLLENALRYNNAEIGPVSLYCELKSDGLYLQVSDHGAGIESQHISRLTEAFYRADPSRERKSGGLGLGLYLCQAVVDAHGGEMIIHSELGDGVRVACRIPLN